MGQNESIPGPPPSRDPLLQDSGWFLPYAGACEPAVVSKTKAAPFKQGSHAFIGDRLVLKDFEFGVDRTNKTLTVIAGYLVVEVFHREFIHSAQFCFFEMGPLTDSKMRGAVVWRFRVEQDFFGHKITPQDTLTFAYNVSFKDFGFFRLLVEQQERALIEPPFSKRPMIPAFEVLSFSNFPEIVKEIVPQVAEFNTERMQSRLEREEARVGYDEQPFSVMSVYSTYAGRSEIVLGDSDDEDEQNDSKVYYNFGGKRLPLSKRGMDSLLPGVWLNDEVINIALDRVQREYPNAHIFDTYTSQKIFDVFRRKNDNDVMPYGAFNDHFNCFFFKNRGKPMDVSETFLSKSMLMFPVNYLNMHWLLIVVVNPLLADKMNAMDSRNPEGFKPSAYMIDSWHDQLELRAERMWKPFERFIRMAAFHHAFSYLGDIKINHVNNIPGQDNSYDCGAHVVVNAKLMAGMFDHLMKGPNPLTISNDKAMEVRDSVFEFKDDFREYLDDCRM